jgi:hypothetical protein
VGPVIPLASDDRPGLEPQDTTAAQEAGEDRRGQRPQVRHPESAA